jgi:hypothetical protein
MFRYAARIKPPLTVTCVSPNVHEREANIATVTLCKIDVLFLFRYEKRAVILGTKRIYKKIFLYEWE